MQPEVDCREIFPVHSDLPMDWEKITLHFAITQPSGVTLPSGQNKFV